MLFCQQCGERLPDDAKFCTKCGFPVTVDNKYSLHRETHYGKLYTCPRCNEIIDSFVSNCPSCGHEFRSVQATSVVKEFARKLEEIEEKREYEKPIKGTITEKEREYVSKTDAQKISLIKSFSIPNTKEDVQEFLILATSCINYDLYDSWKNDTVSRGTIDLNNAWFTKVEQAYEKAKRSDFSGDVKEYIENTYLRCKRNIKIARKKGRRKSLICVMIFLFCIITLFAVPRLFEYRDRINEEKRLNGIIDAVTEAIDNKEYKYALRLADSISYEEYDAGLETEWEIKRGYWIDKVIEVASTDNVVLEYPISEEIIYPEYEIIELDNSVHNDESITPPNNTGDQLDLENMGSIADTAIPADIEKASDLTIKKDAVYTYGYDEWSLYSATAISDSIIKIEKWGKKLSTQKTFDNEYEVGTFRITEDLHDFIWVDDAHTAFRILLQDKKNSDFKKAKTVAFTVSGTDSNTNKGMNYNAKGEYYIYRNDDWHLYRALMLSENILKIECWYRGFAIGDFYYGYDVEIIDLTMPTLGFSWTDEERTSFTISIQDTHNNELRKAKFVSFVLEK